MEGGIRWKDNWQRRLDSNGQLTPCCFYANLYKYSGPDHQLPKGEFHTAYVKYCQKYSIPHEKYDIFCKNVKHRFFELKESKPEIKGRGFIAGTVSYGKGKRSCTTVRTVSTGILTLRP